MYLTFTRSFMDWSSGLGLELSGSGRQAAPQKGRQRAQQGLAIAALRHGVGGLVDGGEQQARGGLGVYGAEGLRLLARADHRADPGDAAVGQGPALGKVGVEHRLADPAQTELPISTGADGVRTITTPRPQPTPIANVIVVEIEGEKVVR